MTDRTYLVEEIKAQLDARGQRWETNEDAFQITGRVAYALRREGAMLIGKTSGQNGAMTPHGKVSHDAIAFESGWIDCLASAGPPANENRPVWHATGKSAAMLMAPYDLDGVEAPVPVEEPPPPVVTPPPPAAATITVEQLAASITELLVEVRAFLDVQTLDQSVLMEAVAQVRSDVTDMRIQMAKGYNLRTPFGTWTLKP